MYRTEAIFNESFEKLNSRWNQLDSTEDIDVAEFNSLYQETLQMVLDVSNAIEIEMTVIR